MAKQPKRRRPGEAPSQRSYYIGAEYIHSGDRLLVEEGDDLSLYSINLELAQHIRVSIGLHVGELVREGRDFYGSHVNYAARVASAAEAGEVVVSSLLREVLAPHREFTFSALPTRALKGFEGEHQLYAASIERS